MDASATRENLVLFQSSGGIDVRASAVNLSRHSAVFEVYSPTTILRVSESLADFKIMVHDRPVYSGRAVVTNLVNAGAMSVCEVSLDDGWIDLDLGFADKPGSLQREFGEFFGRWQKVYRIEPEFKLAVVDIQSFLNDLRAWLDKVELGIRSMPNGNRAQLERQVVAELSDSTSPVLETLFARFEGIAGQIDIELQPAHRAFCQRQLHPLLLASPFMHRIYVKPLGYAGDYEMVNMIMRDPHEGGSVLAKLLNTYILRQSPAVAHRNRISYLLEKIKNETSRTMRAGKAARVFNIACGPAQEVQRFFAECDFSDHTEFTLLDMNDETLMFVGQALERAKAQGRRSAPVKLIKTSVHQLIKNAGKPKGAQEFDFIYCAGLFDYINDRVCKSLMNYFYELLAPGGLLVATNVDSVNPIRNIMEYVFEWHLVYRNGKQLQTLRPDRAPAEAANVIAETSSNNIFLEVRKPMAL